MSRLIAVLGLAVLGLVAGLVLGPAAGPGSLPPVTAAPGTVSVATPTGGAAARATLPPIPPGYRVQVPRLGIDLGIVEGDIERDTVQQRTPEGFAFHLPGTAIPGTGANSFLYAHARRGMFIELWEARVGDEVWISTPDGRALRYVVSEIHPRVNPDDTSWTVASPPDRLTLQTSTGPSAGDSRFVVVARP